MDYHVVYRVVEPGLDMVAVEGSRYPLGGGWFVTRVKIIDGYTVANKETFERIISRSECGAVVEVTDWSPANCDMFAQVTG